MKVTRANRFIRAYERLDKSMKVRVDKILKKINNDPEIGKPMRFSRKGTREVYIKPLRLSYIYIRETETINLSDIYHKDEQ